MSIEFARTVLHHAETMGLPIMGVNIYKLRAIQHDSSRLARWAWWTAAKLGCLGWMSMYLYRVRGDATPREPVERKTFEELLLEDDDDLCSGVVDLIDDHHRDYEYPWDEGVVMHVWQTNYHICNGGFEQLFMIDFDPVKPDFAAMAACYDAIDAKMAADAFRAALSLFPDGVIPEDRFERYSLYMRNGEDVRDAINGRYYDANDDGAIVAALARYIRENADVFRRLEVTSDEA